MQYLVKNNDKILYNGKELVNAVIKSLEYEDNIIEILFHNKITDKLEVRWDNEYFLVNQYNKIKVSTLFPHLRILDNFPPCVKKCKIPQKYTIEQKEDIITEIEKSQKQKKFESDLEIYKMLKDKESDIPVMFTKEFFIFKILDNRNQLSQDNVLELFYELYD